MFDIILGFYLVESVADRFLMGWREPRIHLDAAYAASQVQNAPLGAVCADVARLTSLTDQFCNIWQETNAYLMFVRLFDKSSQYWKITLHSLENLNLLCKANDS